MLSRASWYPAAADLRVGERRRVDHDCGPGRTLTVRNEEGGYSAFCFRCNDRGWEPPAPVPLAVRLERLRKQGEVDAKVAALVALPEPRIYDWSEWPTKAVLWLAKAGLSRADGSELGAFYHPPSERLFLTVQCPVRGVVFWQARSLDGRLPKYIAPPVDKATVVPRYGHAEVVTLTEDILSAYKVGTVGEGWSLLGTSISQVCITMLMQRGCAVNVWLDPDPAGQRAATKVLRTLRGAGVTARRIVSERDPKLLHRADIKLVLEKSWRN